MYAPFGNAHVFAPPFQQDSSCWQMFKMMVCVRHESGLAQRQSQTHTLSHCPKWSQPAVFKLTICSLYTVCVHSRAKYMPYTILAAVGLKGVHTSPLDSHLYHWYVSIACCICAVSVVAHCIVVIDIVVFFRHILQTVPNCVLAAAREHAGCGNQQQPVPVAPAVYSVAVDIAVQADNTEPLLVPPGLS